MSNQCEKYGPCLRWPATLEGLKAQPAIRCSILWTVASLNDPLGFVAPVLLEAKIILQGMCRRGTGWDEPLPDELCPKWEQWRSDLAQLDDVTISRAYLPAGFGKVTKTELHHFSDASLKGYGQCSYLRLQNKDDASHYQRSQLFQDCNWQLQFFMWR